MMLAKTSGGKQKNQTTALQGKPFIKIEILSLQGAGLDKLFK